MERHVHRIGIVRCADIHVAQRGNALLERPLQPVQVRVRPVFGYGTVQSPGHTP